ncbi:MAG: MopE-related protein [Lysobacterales bacterium]
MNCSVTAGDPSPAEACDYLDNDCDGMVDEDFPTLGSVCSAGVGICARTSVMVCNLTGDGTECGASPGEATAESCNGSDDDCDGLVDEDFPGLGDACSVGVGACQQSGIMVCNGPGSGTECSATPAGSTAETCNGIDDDCDGLVDEDFPGLGDACSVGVGACQQSGIMVCNGPGSGTECSAIPAGSTSETCNGIDDDCDGMVDEGIAELCALQTGVCLGSSKQCGGTLGFLDCSFSEYGPSYEPQEVSCDGEDNDCDGSIDNTLFTPYCDSQAGVCAGSVKTCDGANGWLACGPEAYGPEYEPNETVCDYLDNDCDGQVDEGFDLDYDENHCGYCGRVCDSPPNSSAICEFGSCGFSCDSGWYDCDHDYWNGCESAVPCE